MFGANLGYDAQNWRMMRGERSGRWAPWLGAILAGLAIAEVLTAAVLSIIIGWSWRDALEAFVVTNSLMGVTFAGCGEIGRASCRERVFRTV